MNIYISRHGESQNNLSGIIGGDCHLSEYGKEYGEYLGKYFSYTQNLSVWTSKLKRTKETIVHINSPSTEWKFLNEIHAGDFDNLKLSDIKTQYPILYNARNSDKINNSYPNGETYLDLQKRVEQVLNNIDMSIHGTLLIIAHQAVCRVIMAYFSNKPLLNYVNKPIHLHTIYKLYDNNFISI